MKILLLYIQGCIKSVLQCVAVAVCCSVLEGCLALDETSKKNVRVAVSYNALQCGAVWCSVLKSFCGMSCTRQNKTQDCVCHSCSVFQRVSVCCSLFAAWPAHDRTRCMIACVAVRSSVLWGVVAYYSVLQCIGGMYCTRQNKSQDFVAMCCSVLQWVAVFCSVLQCVAGWCSVL